MAQLSETARIFPTRRIDGERLQFVALSGERALVGAPRFSGNVPNSGAAFLYERRPTGRWQLAARLVGSRTVPGSSFGSCALEGDLAVIGAFGDDDLGLITGAAYVFERQGTDWIESARLTSDDAHATQGFGGRVAVAKGRIVVTAAGDDERGINTGAAYVFERDDTGRWKQVAKLLPNARGNRDRLGTGLAFDGERVLVGASTPGVSPRGLVYVFERAPDGSWRQEARLDPPYVSMRSDFFGSALDLSGDRAVVGALNDDSAGFASGAVYVYERAADGHWQATAQLTALDATGTEQLGGWVALSGARILAGAGGADGRVDQSGAAYLFELDAAGQWQQIQKLSASDGSAGVSFGSCVDLEGERALVVAPRVGGGLFGTGEVYVFEDARYRPLRR